MYAVDMAVACRALIVLRCLYRTLAQYGMGAKSLVCPVMRRFSFEQQLSSLSGSINNPVFYDSQACECSE